MKTYEDAPVHFSNEEAHAWEAGYHAAIADALAAITATTDPAWHDRKVLAAARARYSGAVRALSEGSTPAAESQAGERERLDASLRAAAINQRESPDVVDEAGDADRLRDFGPPMSGPTRSS